ncbi:MAG TPA: Scr1 family TA system antitoxin-like transcriptional regulator [Trebonia sp.]
MAGSASNPVRYFGQQVRKARQAAGWTRAEFGQRTGYDPAHLGRIENGKRPATKLIAEMCDRAFPERAGWFGEFYEESRTWIVTPPWFRDWVDREHHARSLRNWYLGVVDGLLQTEDAARAIQSVTPA